MKKFWLDWKFILCIFSFFLGFLLVFCFSPPLSLHPLNPPSYKPFSRGISFDSILFLKIFGRNFFVSLLLSVISFVGFGVLAPIVMLFNGMILGRLLNFHGVRFRDIYVFLVFHGPIEILAFSIFGTIGLKGIVFYNKLFNTGWSMAKLEIPPIKDFVIPTILLVLAAVIESLLMTNY